MSKAKRKKIFQITWLQEDEFKGWLCPISYDNAKCKCIPCGVILSCGKSELQKHTKSLKHRLANAENELIKYTMMKSHKKKVKDAEMKLAIFCIEHNISLKTAEELVLLFKNIFTDSKIAQDITFDSIKYNIMSYKARDNQQIHDDTTETKFIFDNNDDKRSNDFESASEEENIQCGICLETFTDAVSFKLHLPTHTNTVRKLYNCEICKKSFAKFTTYDVHQNIHLGKSELECRYCSRVWKTKKAAVEHNRTHTKIPEFQCERCGKQFVQHTSLRAHLMVHDDIRKVRCNICYRLFRVQAHLTSHMRTHSGERPYDCDVCGRKFSKQCNLKEHRKLHNPISKFECNVCSLVFNKQTILNNHIKEDHIEFYESKKRFYFDKSRTPIYDMDYENKLAISSIEN